MKVQASAFFLLQLRRGVGLTVLSLCQPIGQEVKINSVDFNVVAQFSYFPKDNISSQASHHGPRRYNSVPFFAREQEWSWPGRAMRVQSRHVAKGKGSGQG